jgi:hypothetical protein
MNGGMVEVDGVNINNIVAVDNRWVYVFVEFS